MRLECMLEAAGKTLLRSLKGGLVCGAALVAMTGAAQAVPIPAGLSISGVADYDSLNSSPGTSVSQGGSMSATQGGSPPTTSTITGNTASPDTVGGALTATGDGTSISLSVDRLNDGPMGNVGQIGHFADHLFSFANTSATETFVVRLRIGYSAEVDADGPDAFGDVLFSLWDETNPAAPLDLDFYVDLLSDTVNGDELDGRPTTGTFGANLTASGEEFLNVVLPVGATLAYRGKVELRGGSFSDDSTFFALLATSITIDSITTRGGPPGPTPVPAPGALWLVLTGLSLLVLRRRIRL